MVFIGMDNMPNLSEVKKDADKKPASKPTAVAHCEKKLIKAEWSSEENYCADDVILLGTAINMEPNTSANALIFVEGKGKIAELNSKGQDYFAFPWKVKDVVFEGNGMPDKYLVVGEIYAAGQEAETRGFETPPLEILRVPDKAPEAVNSDALSADSVDVAGRQVTVKEDGGVGAPAWKYHDSATNTWIPLPIGTYSKTSYSIPSRYKIGVEKNEVKVSLKIWLETGWLGKWVSFDPVPPPVGDGMSGNVFVKKDGGAWKYWDTPSNSWNPLPRHIGNYDVNDIIFLDQGGVFGGRDDATQIWPEAFPNPPGNLGAKKATWLNEIHNAWDNRFNLHHKECKSSSNKCCRWRIRAKAQWVNSAGDAKVYAVWAQDWERSDAENWYLTENRANVAAHEAGHLLGAFDEYNGGAVDPNTYIIDANSIMGQNLNNALPRHLNTLRDHVKAEINGWISRAWDFELT
jgi:hypothetical protein